jgi:hypothetical protein
MSISYIHFYLQHLALVVLVPYASSWRGACLIIRGTTLLLASYTGTLHIFLFKTGGMEGPGTLHTFLLQSLANSIHPRELEM